MAQGRWNTVWAQAFLQELARAGVREICVAPGSRSTPLVLAAARLGRFRMFPILDERSAGFFALGLGKSSSRPAAVITTSGTAAANLYPAVIEASQGESPLLVLTADRPHRLRDTDGNQAMDQLRLFGTFPRGFFEVEPPVLHGPSLGHLRSLAARAVALASGPPAGAVHLNFPFSKPLEPLEPGEDLDAEEEWEEFRTRDSLAASGRSESTPFVAVETGLATLSHRAFQGLRDRVAQAKRGVVLVGPNPSPSETGPATLRMAAAAGLPVLADPLSGARFADPGDARVVGGYDLFLRSRRAREALAPDLILRIGGSLTSAGAMDYVAAHEDVLQIVVDDGWRWKDHPASAHEYLRVSPVPLLDRLAEEVAGTQNPNWLGLWTEAEARTREVLEGTRIERDAAGPQGVVPEKDAVDPEVVPAKYAVNPRGVVSEKDAAEQPTLLEGNILAAVLGVLPEGANLLVASSMPIRDLDAFGFPMRRLLRVFGNRGTSGIDGLVSTTVGIGAGTVGADEGSPGMGAATPGVRAGPGGEGTADPTPPTVGVLGDLAFYHDMNGLLGARSLNLPVVFVVINNDGGGIFQALPVREHEPAFTRFFSTPHGLNFRSAAKLYGIPYTRALTIKDLESHLQEALERGGPGIIEIETDREATHRARRSVLEAVIEALEGLGSS